jgi:hypothetical protein
MKASQVVKLTRRSCAGIRVRHVEDEHSLLFEKFEILSQLRKAAVKEAQAGEGAQR